MSFPNGAIHGLQSVIVEFPGHTQLLFYGLQYDHEMTKKFSEHLSWFKHYYLGISYKIIT